MRKAGYAGAFEDVFGAGVGAYKLTRYQSTTCTLSYAEYALLRAERAQQAQQGQHGGKAGVAEGIGGSPRQQAAVAAAAAAAAQQQAQPFRLAGGKTARGQLVTVPA